MHATTADEVCLLTSKGGVCVNVFVSVREGLQGVDDRLNRSAPCAPSSPPVVLTPQHPNGGWQAEMSCHGRVYYF